MKGKSQAMKKVFRLSLFYKGRFENGPQMFVSFICQAQGLVSNSHYGRF